MEIVSPRKSVVHTKIIWACKGFDRDREAGEASRTGCVKFQT